MFGRSCVLLVLHNLSFPVPLPSSPLVPSFCRASCLCYSILRPQAHRDIEFYPISSSYWTFGGLFFQGLLAREPQTSCSMFLALLPAMSPASLAPCHQLAGGFGLSGTTHQCPGKQQENSKSHVGALFFFLVLTTSGKNLDENRGAAGMIEEGFLCGGFTF